MNRALNRFLCAGLMAAGWIMTSCTSDTPDSPDSGKDIQVSFDISGLSRASVTTSINNFAVCGDRKSMEGQTTVIFDNTEVVHTDNGWTYQGTQYWYPNHEHSFVAIHPLSALGSDNSPVYSDSKLTFSYRLPISDSGVEDGDDILAATHRRLFNIEEGNTTTMFTFSHLMSLVNFTLTSEISDDTFYIHHIEFKGLKTGATFSIFPAPLQDSDRTDDRITEVSVQEGEGSLAMEYDDPAETVDFIMIPQAFAADSDAELTITYSKNDNAETTQATASLKGLTWQSGKRYTYKMMVVEESTVLIIKSTSITDWKVEEVGKFDMI